MTTPTIFLDPDSFFSLTKRLNYKKVATEFVRRQIQPKDVVYMPMVMWLSRVPFQKYSDNKQHHHPGDQTIPYYNEQNLKILYPISLIYLRIWLQKLCPPQDYITRIQWCVKSKCNLYQWMQAAFILLTYTKMNRDFSDLHVLWRNGELQMWWCHIQFQRMSYFKGCHILPCVLGDYLTYVCWNVMNIISLAS